LDTARRIVEQLWFEVVLLLVLIAALILVARLLADWARREAPLEDVTLDDARRMLMTGQIDQAEFDRLKARILERERELAGLADDTPEDTAGTADTGKDDGGEDSDTQLDQGASGC